MRRRDLSSSVRPRRIALISSSYHPYIGGVEEHTRHVAKGLASLGVEVEVWTVDRGEHLGRQVVDGIVVRYLPTPLPARRVTKLVEFVLRSPVALRIWRTALREFSPDILHVQCFGPNGLYALVLSWRSRTPLIVTSHGETFADDHGVFATSALLRRGLRAACTRAAAVTGCSAMVTHDLASRFGAQDPVVVPNGVAIPDPAPARTTPWAEREPTVVAAGRLSDVKGFDLLVRAVAQMATDARLVLVGDGPSRQELQDLVEELGVGHRVEFAGRKTAGEVQDIMAVGDVVVVPSRKEAFGIVALEAWASGTPLVATSLGGPRDFVTHGVDGLLVDPRDTSALASAIDRVLTDEVFAQDLSDAGKKSVQQFTWDRVVDGYRALYDDAVASGRRHL